METVQMLFWFGVFGDLVLAHYAVKSGLQAFSCFSTAEKVAGLRKLAATFSFAALAVLLPWSLVTGNTEIGKPALLICILTPFLVLIGKLREVRASRPPGLPPVQQWRDEEWERLHDPFGCKSGHPSADLSDPNDPSWELGR